jgi:hypothetical protein
MKTTVLPRQTIFDIALQISGDADTAVDIAFRNNCILSDDPIPGTELETGEPSASKATVQMLQQSPPATSIADNDLQFDGINFMQIEGAGMDRFIVEKGSYINNL